MDPPYIGVRKTKKAYYNDEDEFNVELLIETVLDLHKKGCYVMLVNSKNSILRQRLSGFTCKAFKANEKILGAHGKRYTGQRNECIYVNY